MKKHQIKLLFFSLIFMNTVLGADAVEPESDLLLDDLLNELKEVTAIATHTKLNVDYVPGMVTVLHGDDLLKKGIFTLSEALKTVPGVEILISNEGQTKYIMRGIGESFSSGKVKFLINGRSMNAAMSAASSAGTLPLELVERIEIIRGSGSSIYGEYAFAGVVNIILRKDRVAYYSGSHHNTHSIGGSWGNYDSDDRLKFAFNLSAFNREGKQVKVESDYFANPALIAALGSNISTTPGYSNEAERSFTSALRVNYKDMLWVSHIQHQEIGDSFGFQNALPPEVEPIRKVITASSDIDKTFEINDTLSGLVSVGGRAYALRGKLHYFLPKGYININGAFPDGVLATPNYTEYEVHSNAELYYSGINKHDILFGLHGSYIKQGNTWAARNWNIDANNNLVPVTLQDFRGDMNWLSENNTRKVASFYAQDQWQVIDALTVTSGVRYDKYFGIDDSINPRLAAVYNVRDRHIFKAQYSQSFRPPTFFELYIKNNAVVNGNENIHPEKVHSSEFGYVYNNSITKTIFRLTIFDSHLHDLIIAGDNSTNQYVNQEEIISRGVELEISQKISNLFSFDANATYIDVKNEATNIKLKNIARILGNANITYHPKENINIMLSDQYIGSHDREVGDTRSRLGAYHVFNTSISLKDIIVKKMTLNFGVKNILDTAVLDPSPLISPGLPSYEGDYPRPGRELWLNIIYKY